MVFLRILGLLVRIAIRNSQSQHLAEVTKVFAEHAGLKTHEKAHDLSMGRIAFLPRI